GFRLTHGPSGVFLAHGSVFLPASIYWVMARFRASGAVPRPPLAAVALAALRLRCPVCREGRLYASWFRMAARCSSCSVPFEREEGFFLGSIYVGYAVTLAAGSLLLAAGLVAGWPWGFLLAAFVGLALLLPFVTWRYSRAAWLALDQWLDPRSPP